MAQFFIRLLFIALLFGSVDAAVDAVYIDTEHNQGPGHLIHDHDESKSNVNDQNDNCNHYCHCTVQLGMIFSYVLHTSHTCVISKTPIDYNYHSRSLSPLFRPPII